MGGLDQTNQTLSHRGAVVGQGPKVHIESLFIREGTARQHEETQMDNFYYASLRESLKHPLQHAERRAAINRLKAKVLHLHTALLTRGQVELQTQDIHQEEMMSLIQMIKRRQRRKQRDIQAVDEQDHERQRSGRDIVRVSSEYIRPKYGPIQVDEE